MDRYKDTKIASILGIIGNIFLLIIKGIVGIITNSQSMIADFFNSFGDVFSSLMTYIGNKISSKKPDADHNLGHGKAEYIYSFVISIVMIITSYTVIKSAITTFVNDNKITFNYLLVVVCIITIITKLSLYLYTRKIYKKHKNILIEANSKDHRNDCFITTMTLLSAILGIYGYKIIDIIVGIIIGLWILYTALKILKESYDVLMDKTMNNETKEEVLKLIKNYDNINKISNFKSTPVGYKYQVSFTIYVDGNMTTFESHSIANNLEKEIEKKIDEVYLCVIHVDPIDINKIK